MITSPTHVGWPVLLLDQPPSKDSNLTLLVRKHRCDVAVSASVLLTLILSHFSDTQCAWDIPVIVKELPGESGTVRAFGRCLVFLRVGDFWRCRVLRWRGIFGLALF